MSVLKEIEKACGLLEKFASESVEHTLWDAYERIEHLEKALKHIRKTVEVNKKGSVVVDLYSDNDARDLKKFIKWALKDQNW